MHRQVYYSTPYDTSKNLGKYYNDFMELLPYDDCWAVFLDSDTIITTEFWGKQIEDILLKHGGDYGLLTCKANRIGREIQRVDNAWHSDDMVFHREIGKRLFNSDYDVVTDITNSDPIGGVLLALSKYIWKEVGGFKEGGMLGIDNDIHYKVRNTGYRVGLMEGFYLYHWYRGGNQANKSHLL